ncbi:MAG: RNA polymerase factor sigma-54 [Spirochaetia bacterium]|nr:RNA polymerase factor sigma-54 [Spirochaetia bacterium]
MANLRQRQSASVRVKSGISLNLKKSLEILSLNTLELSQNIQKSLLENIFLEEIRPPEVSLDEFILHHKISNKSSESNMEDFTYRDKSLQDHLLEQVSVSNLNDHLKELANIIITSINKNGFIKEDHDTIAINNGFSKRELSKVMDFFLQLEPLGVCAKNTWQCLEWQAKVKYPDDVILSDVISILQQGQKEITELDENAIQALTIYINLEESKIRDALKKLKTLEVNPAARYSAGEQNYIIPEIIFSVKEQNIQLNFTNPLLPDVNLNTDMFTSLKKDKNIKQWRVMFHEAQNLLKSVEYRKNAMLKIAKIIANKQKLFFFKGEKYLKPMILKDVAEIAQLNISTVSRIMKNKYCITPYGIFPLSYFLLKKIKSIDDEILGVEDLKKAIKFIVEQENHVKPLPDVLIVEKLKEFGFNIKRRTVTKYRKLLHIPSAKQRTVKK